MFKYYIVWDIFIPFSRYFFRDILFKATLVLLVVLVRFFTQKLRGGGKKSLTHIIKNISQVPKLGILGTLRCT